jgi:long-chain acyl-CoA synthetase
MFAASADRFAERTAFVGMGTSLSFGRVRELAEDFGSYLQNDVRLPPGARVALMMPNLLPYPVALFGALSAGYVVVSCNPLYTARELEFQLIDSGAEAVVVLENFAQTVAQILARTQVRRVIIARIGDLLGYPKSVAANFVIKHVKRLVPPYDIAGAVYFTEALRRGARKTLRPPELGPDHLALLQYTGGTTGLPKGAELTHGNLVANIQQGFAWMSPLAREGAETIVTALPLYHIFALTVSCLIFFRMGATNLLIPNPRDIPATVKALARQRFTAIVGVNTLFNALLNNADFSALDFTGLKIAVAGGMALQKPVADKWRAICGTTLIEGYGLTETSPGAIINPLNLAAYNGAAGLPMPHTDISIRDDAGTELPIGERGELCIKGPQVMRGYWHQPDETAHVFTPDGFLRTGDIATVDNRGFVHIVDRKKDMILVSGFNVYPNEVEEVVAMHPGVFEVGAVGVPDPVTGERVKIVVVRRNSDLTADELIAHCRKYLAGYKVPRLVEFRNELPKTAVGKILRRALREPAPDLESAPRAEAPAEKVAS